ncbi:helix-turn-helix transcriptional regulator [Isobaculum melis]|uniref:CBS domain-containing protein n=1 Tax=Isobaculum melis TaxID=142588 RepID=A0A1H9RS60_9LACT|nr:helix-turn-helix transcriptional regulator [Isobaculum melis]SER75546.1 CBS domain-containing protein [Isobaculum melis]
MELTERQKKIVEIVRENEPISGENIAKKLNLSRPTLRSDFAILTMTGILDARPKVGYFYTGQTHDPLLFDGLFETKVAEIMIPPIFIKQESSVYDAVTMLFMYDIGTLFVAENQQLLGIVSRKDLLRTTVTGGDLNKMPVAMIMTRMPNLVTISSEDRLLDAGYKLIEHEIDSIPVMDAVDGITVVGKLSKTSVLRHFVTEAMKQK